MWDTLFGSTSSRTFWSASPSHTNFTLRQKMTRIYTPLLCRILQIRSTGGGVSPLNRNNSTELCLSRVQFGGYIQFTAEEKGRSPLNRHISLVEANPGPSHVPQIWLPISSDKEISARLETPSDFEKPIYVC